MYHNNDVTLIELIMYNVKNVYSYDTHDVIVYLHYHSDKTRPYKLHTTTNDIEIESPSLYRRLNVYFMPFLKKDLTSAFMQITNSDDEFIWQKVIVDNEDNIEVYECEETVCENEEDEYVEYFLCRRNKRNENEMEIDT